MHKNATNFSFSVNLVSYDFPHFFISGSCFEAPLGFIFRGNNALSAEGQFYFLPLAFSFAGCFEMAGTFSSVLQRWWVTIFALVLTTRGDVMTIIDAVTCAGHWLSVIIRGLPLVSSLLFLPCSVRAELYPGSAHLPAGTRLSHTSCCGGITGRKDCPCCSHVPLLSCCFVKWLSCCTECQRASSSVYRALLTPGVPCQVHQHTHIPGWPWQTFPLSSWPLDTPSPTSSESQLGRRGLLLCFPFLGTLVVQLLSHAQLFVTHGL